MQKATATHVEGFCLSLFILSEEVEDRRYFLPFSVCALRRELQGRLRLMSR